MTISFDSFEVVFVCGGKAAERAYMWQGCLSVLGVLTMPFSFAMREEFETRFDCSTVENKRKHKKRKEAVFWWQQRRQWLSASRWAGRRWRPASSQGVTMHFLATRFCSSEKQRIDAHSTRAWANRLEILFHKSFLAYGRHRPKFPHDLWTWWFDSRAIRILVVSPPMRDTTSNQPIYKVDLEAISWMATSTHAWNGQCTVHVWSDFLTPVFLVRAAETVHADPFHRETVLFCQTSRWFSTGRDEKIPRHLSIMPRGLSSDGVTHI